MSVSTRHLYPVRACRIGHGPNGEQIRRLVMRTRGWIEMAAWLARTRTARRARQTSNNLWIENESTPAVLGIWASTPKRQPRLTDLTKSVGLLNTREETP